MATFGTHKLDTALTRKILFFWTVKIGDVFCKKATYINYKDFQASWGWYDEKSESMFNVYPVDIEFSDIENVIDRMLLYVTFAAENQQEGEIESISLSINYKTKTFEVPKMIDGYNNPKKFYKIKLDIMDWIEEYAN